MYHSKSHHSKDGIIVKQSHHIMDGINIMIYDYFIIEYIRYVSLPFNSLSLFFLLMCSLLPSRVDQQGVWGVVAPHDIFI